MKSFSEFVIDKKYYAASKDRTFICIITNDFQAVMKNEETGEFIIASEPHVWKEEFIPRVAPTVFLPVLEDGVGGLYINPDVWNIEAAMRDYYGARCFDVIEVKYTEKNPCKT